MAIPEKILDGIEHLDPLPVSVQRLIEALGDEEVHLAEVAEIIEEDAAMTANILRLVNSSLYAGRFEITRLRDAVTRLGTSELLNLALGSHVSELAAPAPLYALSEEEIWLHAAVTAQAVREITAARPEAGIPSIAPVAGLLHDIGKLLMVRYLDAKMETVIELCRTEDCSFVEAERRLFGCDHGEVGGRIAEKWGFPEAIGRGIAHHHDTPLPVEDPLLDAVVVANLVAKTIGVGLGAEGMGLEIDLAASRRLGLDYIGFCQVCSRTAEAAQTLRQTLADSRQGATAGA